jgi:protein-S-isoprenylcysteine O-methyltransferase Ste14
MPLRNLIIACWVVFAVYWAVAAAAWSKRTAERQSWAERMSHLLLLTIAFVLLLDAIPLAPLTIIVLPPGLGTGLAGALVCAGGLIFALWARRTLGANWSGIVTLKQDHELVTRGPYCYVRHPIYTGMLAMFLGTALAAGRLGGFLGLAFGFVAIWNKVRQEEALMLRHFPDEYRAYRARVKALIPFVM